MNDLLRSIDSDLGRKLIIGVHALFFCFLSVRLVAGVYSVIVHIIAEVYRKTAYISYTVVRGELY